MHERNDLPPHRSSAVAGLIQRVVDQLAADPRLDLKASNVRVVPDGKRVGLVGWACRLPDKIRIEQIAADAAGAEVASCLLVGPPGQRPDTDIARIVRDSLEEDRWIDATSIQVAVSQGVVRLAGIVDSTFRRKFAGALCWWVQGVRGVVNDLDVLYPSPESDELLGEAIQAVLEKDPLVDRTEILVLCHGGVVTLAGTVGGAVAREAAENDAWIVDGVKDVVNQIEIAPGGAAAGPIFELGS